MDKHTFINLISNIIRESRLSKPPPRPVREKEGGKMTPTIRKTSRTLIENVRDSLCDAPSMCDGKYSKSTNHDSRNNTQTNYYTRTEDAPLRVRTSYSTRPVERIARESIDASRDGRDVRIRTRDGRLSGFNTHTDDDDDR